jgi:hypothetical protein
MRNQLADIEGHCTISYVYFFINSTMSLKQLVKTGFGLGLGIAAAQMLYLAVGLLLLLWGVSLLKKARRGQGSMTTAYFVLALGVIFGLGLGAGFLLDNAMNNF